MFDSNFLRENNAKFNWHPMGHPADGIKNPPPIFVESRGVKIKDIEGNEVIDAVGGLWNVNLGYSNQPVKDAITNQLNALPYYSTFKGSSNDKVIELSYLLKEFFKPEGMARSFLLPVVPIVLKLPCDWPGNITKSGVRPIGPNSSVSNSAITEPILVVPASMETVVSGNLMSLSFRDAFTYLLPMPIKTPSTRVIPKNYPHCVWVLLKMKFSFRARGL